LNLSGPKLQCTAHSADIRVQKFRDRTRYGDGLHQAIEQGMKERPAHALKLIGVEGRHHKRAGEAHSLVVAVLAKETDKCFSVTSGKRLKEGNISVRLKLFINVGEEGREIIHF
jgi:hypothetical protein